MCECVCALLLLLLALSTSMQEEIKKCVQVVKKLHSWKWRIRLIMARFRYVVCIHTTYTEQSTYQHNNRHTYIDSIYISRAQSVIKPTIIKYSALKNNDCKKNSTRIKRTFLHIPPVFIYGNIQNSLVRFLYESKIM